MHVNRVQPTLRAFQRGAMVFVLWLVAFAGLLSSIVTAQAAPVIGSATTVVRDVQGRLEQNWRVVVIDDSVHQDELIRTGTGSAARLIFADRTDFMIGSDSNVVLDKFIYDATSNSGQLVLRATKGLMKFRTGTMTSRSYRLNTPVATVGVRGTEFVVQVFEGGGTSIKVISGEVFVTDNHENSLSVKPGETAMVFPDTDPRAAGGPVLIGQGDFVLNNETREMISQIVFSETVNKTQLAATGKQTPAVTVNGNAVSLSGIAGQINPPISVRPVRQPQAGQYISPQPLLAYSAVPVPSVLPVPRGLPGSLFNGGFDSGLSGWTVRGQGSASVITDPTDSQNRVLELVSGSPVSIEQEFDSMGEPFEIHLRRLFLDLAGSFQVLLDDNVVGTFDAQPGEKDFTSVVVLVDDPAIYGQPTIILKILFNAPLTGTRLLLDDLALVTVQLEEKPTDVPAPPGIVFAVSGIAGLVWLSRRRRWRRGNMP